MTELITGAFVGMCITLVMIVAWAWPVRSKKDD